MRYISLGVLAIALTGCVPNTDNVPIPSGDKVEPSVSPSKPMDGPSTGTSTNPPVNSNSTTGGDTVTSRSNEPVRPDNTGVNERDSDGTTKTPIDQDETSKDVQITADIRKQVLATEGMSVNARNAKIITSKGHVTLRGPVNSDDEKTKIEKIAANVAGAGNVTSELEVAK